MNVQIVLLCGGSGSRLWPQSRESLPKQFMPIIKDKSLLELTLERAIEFKSKKEIIIVCNKKHGHLVKKIVNDLDVDAKFILEPEGKNTTAAIYIAAKALLKNENLIIMPTDHYISNDKLLVNDVKNILSPINNL